MVRGDAEYNKHYRYMVAGAISCGLTHPIEWITDYSRCLGTDYNDMAAVEEFCQLASYDLYECVVGKATDNPAVIQDWMEAYYLK